MAVHYNSKGRLDMTSWHLANVFVKTMGLSTSEAARRLNLSRATVRRALSTPFAERQGRAAQPRVQKKIQDRRRLVARLAQQRNPSNSRLLLYPSCALIARRLATHHHLQVSASTVRRDLRALNMVARRRPKGPGRKPLDEARRKAFARHHLSLSAEQRYLFSDEKYVDCNDHGCQWQWCAEGQKADHRCFERWTAKVHVWGLIGVGVKVLVILPTDRMTADQYVRECIRPHVAILRGRNTVFVQDGAKAHTARATLQYLSSAGVAVVQNWPARSPDLNPIENLWAILSRKVSDKGPTSYQSLVRFIREEWDSIPQALVDELTLSFQHRLKKCVQGGGKTVAETSRKRQRDG